ncbi:MAG: sigma 54-interacting transcriptional regulator, partial [Planctomycetota bacterium]
LALLRLRLREERRGGPLEAVAERSRGPCAAARWDLLRAWTHRGRVGEARALMDEGAEEVTSLEAWQAAAAASLLVRAGSPVEALPYLEHAVGVARTPQARLGHATEAVRLALSLGRREQAQRLLATLEDGGLLSETGLLRLEPPSAQGLAALLVSMGRSQLAETLFHQALAGARKLGRKGAATVISALSGLAGGSRSRSDLAEAERLLRLGIRYARHAGLSGEARHLEANLAAVQYSRRQPDLALATYRRLEKRVRREGNLRLLPHVGLGIGTIHRERGDLLRALRTLARAARDARASGNDPARAAVLANLGELYLLLGDPRSSYRSRLEVLRIARRIGDHSLIRQARCALGGSLVRLGRVREAHRMLEEALEMEGEDTGLRVRAVIHASLAEARELEEDSGGALRCWARASRDALRSHRSYVASRSITGLARAVAQRGDPQRAQRLLDRAAEIARSDPCPALSRIPARLERLRLDWQPGGARRALARELRNLYDTAMRYGLREEALAVVYLLGQREGEDQEDPRPSLPGAATLLAGFRRRMGGTEVAALGRRLGLPGLSGMMPGEILFRGPLPVAIQHLPAEERGVGGKGALALDRLRRRWRATRAQLLCFHDGELARWGMATESEAHLETLPHPCNEGAAPRRPAQARKGALEQREQGTWARIPLALPGKEAAFLLLDLPTPAPPPPSEEDLRVLETELAERIGAWRRHSDREEIGRLRKLVDHLREETLAEKERLETEILTQRLELQQAQENLRDGDPTGVKAPRWVALAPEMQRIERNLEAWSATRLPVLLHGESGVGKSALARRLHQAGPRRDSILLVENCTALPEPLLEAELFGYRRGAFTSADRDHPGLLERAAGGTLLLDHLDELPPTTQAKLLRVLDDGRFRPLGSGEELELDLRLMTTCRRPPREATRDGLLREDLYYRLQGIEIEIPPLRERRQEIEPLLTGFLQWHGRRLHLPVPAITAESLRLLLDYSRPGNVRELANLSQRWLIQRLRTITPEDFAPAARTPSPSTSLFRSELPW